MSKILIKNCNLISVDETRKRYEENIDVLINNDIIEKIDKDIVVLKEKDEDINVIDAKGKILMPGFVNTHAHLAMSAFKETSEEHKLQDWLENVIWPAEDKMTEEDVYYLSLLSCIELIKTGTTTVNDQYFMPIGVLNAAKTSGVNMLLTRAIMDNDDKGKERLRELEELIEECKDEENIKVSVGIHGLYTNSEKYIQKGIDLAKKNSLPIHMHFCENAKEVEDIKKDYKVKYPAQILAKYFSNTHNILAHLVKISDEDLKIMKKLNISISHCPISNLKLGCGIARIKDFLNENINVTLGTDGQGSGDNVDMFEVMKFTSLLQKGINEDPKLLPAYEVIQMATINGAKALCMNNRGCIKVNNKADAILIDLEKEAVTRPVNDIFSDIVYNAKGTNVVLTIINGKIVMQDRKLSKIDEDKIYKKCEEIAKRILAKIRER